MSSILIRRRGIVLASAAWATGLQRPGIVHAAASEGFLLSRHLATRVVFLQVKKTHAKTGAIYTLECTGCMVGKDGWVATAAHTFSDPIRDPKTGEIIPTLPTPDVSASIGQRNLERMEPMQTPVIVNNTIDFALLQFRFFSDPRDQLLLGRASDIDTGELVHVSGFMYSDKPMTNKTMTVESKGGKFPFWNLGGDAAPGLSGSPIMNDAGDLVGIFSGGDKRPAGGNYGIPINRFHDQLADAEPVYADGTSWSTRAHTQSTGKFQKDYDHKFRAPPAKEENVIKRSFTKTYLVPLDSNIESASFSVNDEDGLVNGPMVTVDERNVSVAYSLQSGPKSTGKVGWLEGTLTMDLTKKS